MKLKIAYIVPSFPVTTETFVVNQITDMIDRDHKIKIYAFKRNKDAIIHQKVKDYDLLGRTVFYDEPPISLFEKYSSFLSYLIRNYSNINWSRLLKHYSIPNFSQALRLRYYCKYYWILSKNDDPDIIHIHFGDKAKFVANMKRDGFFANTKMIVTFHGYDLEPASIDRMQVEYKNIFQEADLLTVNSPYSKDLLLNLDSQNCIETLPVGLDTEKFQKKINDRIETFNILFIGRLIALKAPQLTIRIVEMLTKRGLENVRLTIIGEGALRLELEKEIDKKNLSNQIILKGALSQEEIVSELETAAVLLMPGIYDVKARAETQGLVIQEAQAMEIPVIVSDAGGMKYGMIENKTGFVVKQGDLEGFADKIELLMRNEGLRKEMGRNGRAYIEKKFDYRILGDKLEQIYFDLKNHK